MEIRIVPMSDIQPNPLPRLKRHIRVPAGAWAGVAWPAGVSLTPLKKHRDDRGFFMEVVRFASLAGGDFPPKQVSISETGPGVVKAFHFHRKQTDLFCPLRGNFRIVLLDSREGATHGHGFSIFSDEERSFLLRIPPGVAHGYEVVGPAPALMLYIMDREYDPTDECRVEWNDPAIAFPWRE